MKKIIQLILIIGILVLPVTLAAQDVTQRTGLRPDAPPYGLRGPYPVGALELVIEPDSERPLITTAWYPALNPDGLEEKITYPALPEMGVLGRAIADAPFNVSDGPYPLIIFSHGGSSWRSSAPYLVEQLASYGFVVLSVNHFGDSVTTAREPEFMYMAIVQRPQDITRILDAATEFTASDGALAGMIDMEHVGVTGISGGGYTALMAGGARVLMQDYEQLCTEFPNQSPGCINLPAHIEEMAELAGLDAIPEGLWPAWNDERVDAIAPIVPGPGIIREGASGVTVPTLMLIGGSDPLVPAIGYQYPVWESLTVTPRALVEFEGAGHTFSVLKCADVPWSGGIQWWCSDPVWDMDRAHDLVNHFVTAFFMATLKEDADAQAALAPDAVSFPGIAYEAQGF